jgi:hypothetical protein
VEFRRVLKSDLFRDFSQVPQPLYLASEWIDAWWDKRKAFWSISCGMPWRASSSASVAVECKNFDVIDMQFPTLGMLTHYRKINFGP